MKGLTGVEAVVRLERRGGQVQVFRMGHGSKHIFGLIEREGSSVVVAISDDATRTERRRMTLRSEEDRVALARQMERARDIANANLAVADSRYKLVHRDLLETDGGYGQVGCLFVIASLIIGLVIGLVGAWMATGGVAGSAVLAGLIIGFVVGFYASDQLAALAVGIPALRDRIVTLAYVWSLVVPGAITAVTIILLTRQFAQG